MTNSAAQVQPEPASLEQHRSKKFDNREATAAYFDYRRALRIALTGDEYKLFDTLIDFICNKPGDPRRGWAFPSYDDLTEATGLNYAGISKAIKRLEELGIVEIDRKPGKGTLYRPLEQASSAIAQLLKEQPYTKRKGNFTSKPAPDPYTECRATPTVDVTHPYTECRATPTLNVDKRIQATESNKSIQSNSSEPQEPLAAAANNLFDKKKEPTPAPAEPTQFDRLATMLREAGFDSKAAQAQAEDIQRRGQGKNCEMILADAIKRAGKPGVKSRVGYLKSLIQAEDFFSSNNNGAAPSRPGTNASEQPGQPQPGPFVTLTLRSESAIKREINKKHNLDKALLDRLPTNRTLINRRLEELADNTRRYISHPHEADEKAFLLDFLAELDREAEKHRSRTIEPKLEKADDLPEKPEMLYPEIASENTGSEKDADYYFLQNPF